MDYNVFVVSRIREAHDRGLPTRQAVAHGIRSTAGVVTSAAVIMVAVFAVFGMLSVQQFKQLAVGLAVSVLIDATVIRAVLLPSVMTLLGERNWYLPRWLARFTLGRGAPRPPAGPLPPAGPHPEAGTGGQPWILSSS
jgi:RND superfamily putative drug exporter